jgi:Amidohydrolase family
MRSGLSPQQAMEAYDRQTPELFRTFVGKGTVVVPTLVVSHPAEPATEPDPRAIYVPASVKRQWASLCPPPTGTPDARALEIRASRDLFFGKYCLRWVKEMQQAGVRLLAGTDLGVCGVYPGFSLHDELDWLVKAGLNPMEALQAATRNPAIFLGKSDMGTLEPGKSADIVILDRSPLDGIANTKAIRAVVLRGQLLHRDALDKLLAGAAAAAGSH